MAGIFVLKVFAGICLCLIYTYYYTDRQSGDIYKYFYDGEVMYGALFTHPGHYFQMVFGIQTDAGYLHGYFEKMSHWYKPNETTFYNDNRTIIRFNALVRLFSLGSIWVHTVVMCFISFLGLTAVYKTLSGFLQDKKKELAAAIFLLPSVMFWGSGLLKEGILLFAMGGLIYCFIKLAAQKFSLIYFFGFFFGVFLLCISKIYVLFALVPPMAAYWWVAHTNNQKAFLKYLVVFGVMTAGAFNLHYLFPDFDIARILARKQQDFINMVRASDAGSYFEIPKLDPNVSSIIKNTPIALFNMMVRPHLLESNSPFILLAAIENILLTGIIIFCIIFKKRKPGNKNLLFFCIGYVLILYSVIGLTTPVLGALVRYKAPGLPFLALIFIIILDKQKILHAFKWLNVN